MRVYYPRDISKLRREFARRDERILIHISNFRPVKRVQDVVDIFAKISRKVPSRLLFVGEGPDLSTTISKIRELGLTDKVTFCWKQDDVAQLISLAYVMLLPSEKERLWSRSGNRRYR